MSRSRLLLVVPLLVLAVTAPPWSPSLAGPAPTAFRTDRPGSASDHTWLAGDRLARWPCGPLTYRVNPAAAPPGWRTTLRKALHKATRSSGIRFRYVGRSHQEVRSGSRNPRGTDVVIAFLEPGQTDLLADEFSVGTGGATVSGRRLSNGRVVINGPMLAGFEDGFGEGPVEGLQGTRGQVLMHEIGHALGLGHAADATQVMYPSATRKPAAWGAGDHRGLRILGRGRGRCGRPRTAVPPAPAGAPIAVWLG